MTKRRDGCSGKVRHSSRLSAIIALKRVKNCALDVYRCPRCEGWHLGKTHDAYRRAERINQVLRRYNDKLERRLTTTTKGPYNG